MSADLSSGARLLVLFVALACGCERCDKEELCSSSDSTASVGGIWTIEGEGDRAGCLDPKYNGFVSLGPSAGLAVEQYSEEVDAGPREAGPLPREAGSVDVPRRDATGRDAAGADRGAGDGAPRDGAPRDGTVRDLSLGREKRDPSPTDAMEGPRPRRDLPPVTPPRTYRTLLRVRNPPPGFTLTGSVRGSCVSFETEETIQGLRLHHQFTGKAKTGRTIEGRFTGDGPQGCLSSGTFKVEYR